MVLHVRKILIILFVLVTAEVLIPMLYEYDALSSLMEYKVEDGAVAETDEISSSPLLILHLGPRKTAR